MKRRCIGGGSMHGGVYRSFLHLAGHQVLVDIGCGSGEMLLEGGAFFPEVLGFEINQPLVAYAREKYGLDVRSSHFGRGSLPEAMENRRKVFALSHVLEHLASPEDLLREIRAACQPGDLLYVEVPLHTGESFRTLGYDWNLWNDEHLMLFSQKSLNHLLATSGFRIAHEGTRIFARGSHSSKTRLRLLRRDPLGFVKALLNKSAAISVADYMIADYGFVVAEV